MNPKPTKPNLPLLLDANIVIEAYRLSAWDSLIQRRTVVVPSIVIDDEALFYSRQIGDIPKSIQLARLVSDGSIGRVEATADEMSKTGNIFDRVFIEGLHDGEMEALAIIDHRPDQYMFSSGDVAAIKALAMLGHSHAGISFERILQEAGLAKRLEKQFRDEFFREQLVVGQTNRIQGIGLKKI